jgi:hypothetical protein
MLFHVLAAAVDQDDDEDQVPVLCNPRTMQSPYSAIPNDAHHYLQAEPAVVDRDRGG